MDWDPSWMRPRLSWLGSATGASSREGDEILVELYGMRPVRAQPGPTEVRLPSRLSADTAATARAGVGLVIREAMYFCHDALTATFKPNVAQRPMSDPFVIQLPGEARASTQGLSRELEVRRVRCRSSTGPLDHVRIAIANLVVPEAQLNAYKIDKDAAGKVTHDVRVALREAVKKGCQAIVFPEYSIPKALGDDLLKAANDHGIVIIGGLEGDWKGNKLVDKALVTVPGETELHHQFKQEPSLYEEAGTAFHRDNVMRLFSGTPIGDFAVTVCSDWLESATMRVWTPDRSMPEVHIIVARNSYTDLYRSFAIADSMRLYAAIVVANVCETETETGKEKVSTNDGSGIVVPHAKRPELDAERIPVGGTFCRSLSVFDLNPRAQPGQAGAGLPRGSQERAADTRRGALSRRRQRRRGAAHVSEVPPTDLIRSIFAPDRAGRRCSKGRAAVRLRHDRARRRQHRPQGGRAGS